MPVDPTPPPFPLPDWITTSDVLPKKLLPAIAKLKRIHAKNPATPATYQYDIMNFIKDRLDADRVVLHLTDAVGRCIGSLFWPLTTKNMEPFFKKFGPAYWCLSPCDEIWEYSWNQALGTAFIIPWMTWRDSPTYDVIYSELGHDHIILSNVAYREKTGNHLIIGVLRSNEARNPQSETDKVIAKARNQRVGDIAHGFSKKKDKPVLEEICEAFMDELGACDPEGVLAPSPPRLPRETVALNASLEPGVMTPYAVALISRFFGILREERGRKLLPIALVKEIKSKRESMRERSDPNLDKVLFNVNKNYLGRFIEAPVEAHREGTAVIQLEEKTIYDRLVKIIKACREPGTKRGRRTFQICLLREEGLKKTETDEIGRRLDLDPLQAKGDRFLRDCSRADEIIRSLD